MEQYLLSMFCSGAVVIGKSTHECLPLFLRERAADRPGGADPKSFGITQKSAVSWKCILQSVHGCTVAFAIGRAFQLYLVHFLTVH